MKKIFCIGELLIDFICEEADLALREAIHFTKKVGGAPGNVAATTARLGCETSLLASVGADPFGDFLVDTLAHHGVHTESVKRDPDNATSMAFVSLSQQGERGFVFNRGADASLGIGDFDHKAITGEILHLGSATALLGGALEQTYTQLLEWNRQSDTFIAFDPNFRPALWPQGEAAFIRHCADYIESADLIKLSREELQLLMREDNTEKAMDRLHEATTATSCITLGAQGAWLSTREARIKIPAFEVKTIDTTGAGDAFVGAVLDRLARGARPKEAVKDFQFMTQAVRFANRVAGLTTTQYGAQGALDAIQAAT